MFPIPWNFPLRKKNGNLVNIGDAIDAGTEIPEHDEGDAGKVLSVDENGDLEWSDEVNSEIQTLTNEVRGNWSEGGKNKLVAIRDTVDCNASQTVGVELGTITLDEADTLILSFEQNIAITSIERNTLYLHPSSGSDLYPINTSTPSLNAGYHEGIIANVPAGTYTVKVWFQNPSSNVSYTDFMVRSSSITDTAYQPYAMTNKELTESVNSLKMKHIAKQITLTANSTTILDLSSDLALPSGSVIQSLQLALSLDNTINSSFLPLPYCDLSTGDVKTWVERFNPDGSNVKISNLTSAWTNYYLHAVAFYT